MGINNFNIMINDKINIIEYDSVFYGLGYCTLTIILSYIDDDLLKFLQTSKYAFNKINQ